MVDVDYWLANVSSFDFSSLRCHHVKTTSMDA